MMKRNKINEMLSMVDNMQESASEMKKKQRKMKLAQRTMTILIVIVSTVLAYGYILNIIYIASVENFSVTGKLILSVIGVIIPPLGAIMGYIS